MSNKTRSYGDQDEIDVHLRSPVEVRTRIVILAAVLRRLALENPAVDDGGDCLLKRSMSGSGCESKTWPASLRQGSAAARQSSRIHCAGGGQRGLLAG